MRTKPYGSLQQCIVETLWLAEERDYNLTVEQRSLKLLGGSISIVELCSILLALSNIEMDSNFIAIKGQLYREKCQQRQYTNTPLQLYYQPSS